MLSLWNFFTAKVAVFRASVYRDCKSNDDLLCNKVLNASFFARIASLTSWFIHKEQTTRW